MAKRNKQGKKSNQSKIAKPKPRKRIFFQGLNEIRALAALFVLFHHVELYKFRDKLPSLYDTFLKTFIGELGKNGVYIFFVLSGFLITYLLLEEKRVKKKIDLKKFYIRRLLRIWPLYYLIIFISFFILPFMAGFVQPMQNETTFYTRILVLKQDFWTPFLLFLVFLPNLALKLKAPVTGAAQAWSVGVEEQFYLIWPNVVNLVKSKYLIIPFVIIISLPYWAIPVQSVNPSLATNIRYFTDLVPIHIMGIGALGAYLLFHFAEKLLMLFRSPVLFIINSIILVILLSSTYDKVLLGTVVALQLIFIIQTNFKLNLRNKILNKLGEISYGIYMFHPIAMYIGFSIFNSVIPLKSNIVAYNIAVYSTILGLTLFISYISFHYFESWFIKLKNKKFTVIPSGKKYVETTEIVQDNIESN